MNSEAGEAHAGEAFAIGTDEHGESVELSEKALQGSMLVLGDNDIRQTEFLIWLATNRIRAGAGLVFIGGRTERDTTVEEISRIADLHGRSDDVLVLDHRATNPLIDASWEWLTQAIVDLLPVEEEGDGAVWKGRTVLLLGAVLQALTWRRDHGETDLSFGLIREHLGMDLLFGLSEDERLPAEVRRKVCSYLGCLPYFDRSRGARQQQSTLEQHGYLQMTLSSVLAKASDGFGAILATPTDRIDLGESVRQQRILLLECPDLNGPDPRAAALPRFVVAKLKEMAARRQYVGGFAPATHVALFHQAGRYIVEGAEEMVADDHGFCFVFSDRYRSDLERRLLRTRDALERRCLTGVGVDGLGNVNVLQGDRFRTVRPEHGRF